MKRIRFVGLTVMIVCALTAVAAASAAASPEFDAAKYPVEVKSDGTNVQALGSISAGSGYPGGVVIACKKATANTNEDAKTANPTKNSPTLTVHPVYAECWARTPIGSFTAEARTTGCDYKLHAVAPAKLEGSVDIECETGKEIEYVLLGLEGCVISVKPQNGLTNLEYKNEPATGTEKAEVTTAFELSRIKSKATETCPQPSGTAEFEAAYREGQIGKIAGVVWAEIEPAGHPANIVTKGLRPGTVEPIAVAVGDNEPQPPSNTGPPEISGPAQVGQTLSCSTGSWTGNPSPTFTYQWLRDGSNIGGANSATYVVQAADQGHTLTCAVTGSNSAGHQTATSSGMAIPNPLPPPRPPTITTAEIDPPASLTPSSGVAGTTSSAPPQSKPLTRAQKLANALMQCTKKPKRKRKTCELRARQLYGAKKKGKKASVTAQGRARIEQG